MRQLYPIAVFLSNFAPTRRRIRNKQGDHGNVAGIFQLDISSGNANLQVPAAFLADCMEECGWESQRPMQLLAFGI